MSSKSSKRFAQPAALALTACLALTLSACGGGGGSPGNIGNGPITGNPELPVAPKIAMTIVDGADKPITTLSGGQSANVRVTVTDSRGAIVKGEIVTFTANPLLAFTPGSAVTDDKGVAVVQVKPASNTSAGAAAVIGTVVVASQTATATVNLTVGASPLVVTSISAVAPPARLPAFSTVALNIALTTGGLPASISTGLTLSSLCTGDGLATIVLGSLAGGVQTATYTNNGCLRGTDIITAAVGNSVQTTSLVVDSASIGTIQFVGSDLQGTSIVIKGSGGLGRQESALLTYRVLDQNNQGLAGVDVDFSASTNTGGLTVAPSKGTTDATGRVTTTVSAGTIPTPVRVFAQASRNGKTISGLSDTLTVSTGLPIQKFMSLSSDSLNIEGWERDGTVANVSVRMADQYGNPISDDTAVSFITEGGAVGSSLRGACITKDGGCSVQFRSQEFRPLNGRVTVLAYVQGLENFTDSNGDGQYTCTSTSNAPGTIYRPLLDTCISGGESFVDQGDPFLDVGLITSVVGLHAQGRYGSLDGSYDNPNGDLPVPYERTTYSAAGNNKWGLNYIWRSTEITLSGKTSYIKRQVCDGTTPCRDWVASDGIENIVVTSTPTGCTAVNVALRVYDLHNNPLPSGTTVSVVDADEVATSTMAPGIVPSTADIGGTIHMFTVKPDLQTCKLGSFGFRTSTPFGNGTVHTFTTR